MTETLVDTSTVLLTRPAHQNANLARMLKQDGFAVLSFPTIDIQPTEATPFLKGLSTHIRNYDIALFVSRNAVDHAFHYLDAGSLPAELKLGVIGKGTWQALRNQGVETGLIPADSFNSEGLLAAATLQQVCGMRVLIFRGQEGRNLLGYTLMQRGARVDHVEVYRRTLPIYPAGHFTRLCEQRFPAVAVFTSSEGLINCFELLSSEDQEKIRRSDWLLISERMRETARNLGHNAAITIAHSASDDGIHSALQEWRQNKA